MKNLTIIAFLFFCSIQVQAQKGQSVYVEGGGAGLIYSINYDRRFSEGDDKHGMRFGFGIIEGSLFIPVHYNYLFGAGNHKLETGIGFTALLSGSNSEVAPTGALMYRFQKKEGPFSFRIGISPIYRKIEKNRELQRLFLVWPGISIGCKF